MKKILTLNFLVILALVIMSGTLHSASTEYFTDPATRIEFVYVQGGCYQMGDSFGDGYAEEIPHEVCVDDFYIGKYEVTMGEYKRLTGDNSPTRFKKGNNYPVTASWLDSEQFLKTLNEMKGQRYRLPTEAEWEYAARSGGKKEKYAGSNSANEVAWHDGNSGGSSHPVGEKLPNGLGLFDMSGNLREWCQDWYDTNYYKSSPRNNPQGPDDGVRRVVRGGGWRRTESHVRTSYRDGNEPDDKRRDNLGLRLVMTIEK